MQAIVDYVTGGVTLLLAKIVNALRGTWDVFARRAAERAAPTVEPQIVRWLDTVLAPAGHLRVCAELICVLVVLTSFASYSMGRAWEAYRSSLWWCTIGLVAHLCFTVQQLFCECVVSPGLRYLGYPEHGPLRDVITDPFTYALIATTVGVFAHNLVFVLHGFKWAILGLLIKLGSLHSPGAVGFCKRLFRRKKRLLPTLYRVMVVLVWVIFSAPCPLFLTVAVLVDLVYFGRVNVWPAETWQWLVAYRLAGWVVTVRRNAQRRVRWGLQALMLLLDRDMSAMPVAKVFGGVWVLWLYRRGVRLRRKLRVLVWRFRLKYIFEAHECCIIYSALFWCVSCSVRAPLLPYAVGLLACWALVDLLGVKTKDLFMFY